MNNNVKVYHLYHSGVAVEVSDLFLLFDYYYDQPLGRKRNLGNGVVTAADLKQKEKVYVFVSHGHSDHFNAVIFDWNQEVENINYILSDDVYQKQKGENLYYTTKDEKLKFEDLDIKTFGSTDRGISFLVKTETINIFHAGDLNWWHWKSFSEKQLKEEERDFKREVDKLKAERIDIAFVPVDPRLEEYYYLAGEYFVHTIKPEVIIPIHFSDKYEITEKFASKMGSYDVKVVKIKSREEGVRGILL